jgi:TM2 domain-containing membrane protein YozV
MQERSKKEDEKYCSDCASIIKLRAEICPHCGCRQIAAPMVPAVRPGHYKNKHVAAVLAFFFGIISLETLYLGKGRWYILANIFCLMIPVAGIFICIVGAIVRIIYYLSMSDEQFDVEYNGAILNKEN